MNENEKRLQQDQWNAERQQLIELREKHNEEKRTFHARVAAIDDRCNRLTIENNKLKEEIQNARKYTNCANLLGQINEELGIDMFHEPADTTLKRVKELKSDLEYVRSEHAGAKRQLDYRAGVIDQKIAEIGRLWIAINKARTHNRAWGLAAFVGWGLTVGFAIIIWQLTHR
jgi:chromosome segregation ATPase